MKRLWAVAILAVAMPGFGQIRGVPASVTSFGQDRGNTPGVPASVTSLGPRGFSTPHWSQPQQHGGRNFGGGFNTVCSTGGALIPSAMGCTNTSFTNQFYGLPVNATNTSLRSRNRGRGHGGGVVPVYVPYAVPVVVEEEPAAQPDMHAIADDESEEPPAMTVFERRPKLAPPVMNAPAIDESRVYHPAPNQVTAPASAERVAPAIVLVYKDGHQREVQNYAIMGNYIYDMGMFVAQKIPLSELNLKATLKVNDERGVDFALPAGVMP